MCTLLFLALYLLHWQVFVGDGSSRSFSLTGLSSGVKYSVRARAKDSSTQVEATSLYSAFGRAVSFTTPAPAGSSNGKEDQKSEAKRSPQAQAGTANISTASAKVKPYQRQKKPPKAIQPAGKEKEPTLGADQRRAIFISVIFVVVAIIVAIAVALHIVS